MTRALYALMSSTALLYGCASSNTYIEPTPSVNLAELCPIKNSSLYGADLGCEKKTGIYEKDNKTSEELYLECIKTEFVAQFSCPLKYAPAGDISYKIRHEVLINKYTQKISQMSRDINLDLNKKTKDKYSKIIYVKTINSKMPDLMMDYLNEVRLLTADQMDKLAVQEAVYSSVKSSSPMPIIQNQPVPNNNIRCMPNYMGGIDCKTF